MISIVYGEGCSDCTYPYYITIDKPKTVGEFIEEWLSTRPKEWGSFGIRKIGSIYGDPRCDYKYGKIVSDPLPDEYLAKEIKSVSGGGGWTLSNFMFEV